MQNFTDPHQLAPAAPDAPSIVAPSTVDPSTASMLFSVLQSCSYATTMSTREINEWIDKELGEEEVDSTYHTNKAELDLPLDDTFNHGISLSDFDGPEIQIDNNIDSEICTSNNLDFRLTMASLTPR